MSPAPRLPELVEGLRRGLARRTWLAALPWAAVAVALVLLAAWLLVGPRPEGWTQGTAAPLFLDLALVVALAAGVGGVRRLLGERLAERRLTADVEEEAELAPGTLRGALELGRGLPPGVSPSLARRAEAGLLPRLTEREEELPRRLGRPATRWARRGWMAVAALTPLLAAAAVATPERSGAAWRGLTTPVRLLARPVLPALRVHPGDVEVERGGDAEVVVTAPMRDSVELRWQEEGEVARSETRSVGDERARFVLREVEAPLRYTVVAPDGAVAGPFTVTPVDPLFVTELTVGLSYPPHTGLPREELRGDLPPLVLPAGTELSVRGRASRPLSEGGLVDSAGRRASDFRVDGSGFRGDWRPVRSGVFEWSFRDAEGEPAGITPLPLEITVVADSAPTVRFTFPARDTVLPLDLRQALAIEASDDHGIGALELVAWRVTALGEAMEPRVRSFDLGGTRAVGVRPVLDLSGWELLPGDTVRYYARIRDNAPEPGSARTREYLLRMPGAAEMRREAGRELDEAAERLEEMAARAARSEGETRDLERRSRAGRPDRSSETRSASRRPGERPDGVDFDEREELRRAVEEQAAMEAAVDSLRGALEEISEALREAGASEPGLREELEELRRLMEEAAPAEGRDELERALDELGEMRDAEARRTLEDLLEKQGAFREQLERSVERLKRAAVEQDFRATAADVEELARQEEALAEALREGDDPEKRAAQQDALEERATEAGERMERLEQRLQELGETDAAGGVRESRRRASDAAGAMQAASEAARRGRSGEAGDEAERASREMDEAAEALREARGRMARERARAMEQALRRAAEDALSLARRQSELRQEMRGAARERAAALRGDQAAVERGLRNLADNLGAATAAGGGSGVEERIGAALESVREAVEAMDGGGAGGPSAVRRAEDAVDALNRVALSATELARGMSQDQSGRGQSSGEAVQQQLEELAGRQGQLNNQAGQMMPMQLGRGAMRSQMERLSREQRSVAEGLRELSRRQGAEEAALGDVESLATEAAALADRLEGARLDPETRARQERLFHRLLDAGRSLEKEEWSDERESEVPGTFERGEVVPLDEGALRALRYRLPEAAVLQRLSPAERRLVIEYFERLNRAGGGGERPEGGG